MEAPSQLVGGQAAQPSATGTKKSKRRQKMKDTQKQFKKLKADYAELVKSEASSKEILDPLKNDLEKAREAKRVQEQIVEQQNLMINILLQHLQLPFGMTVPDNTFGTEEAELPVHHPLEGPAIEESLGLPQSHLPQGLTHGNTSEESASANDDQFPGVP